MNLRQVSLIVFCLLLGSVVVAQVQETKQEQAVKRARRPDFSKQGPKGVFFEDIVRDGLVGEKPSRSTSPSVAVRPPGDPGNAATANSAGSWSDLVGADVLENEVKRLQQLISTQVTTPLKFKTTHSEIGEQFSMLAMWFAVIGQYDSDVRWKDSAGSARIAFLDAARKSRDTDMSSFNNVQRRSQDLTELVRGGRFPGEPGAEKAIGDWASVIGRDAVMVRLETAVSDNLKKPTSSENELKANAAFVIHEAGLVAAMGRVLQSPEMMDADDDDYNALAQMMVAAAQELQEAAKGGNLDEVNASLNRINQSCVDCHADWR